MLVLAQAMIPFPRNQVKGDSQIFEASFHTVPKLGAFAIFRAIEKVQNTFHKSLLAP